MSKEIELELYLKSGQSFTVVYTEEQGFGPDSFTDKSIHSIRLKDGGQVFVQGDNIACLVRKK